MLLPKIQLTSTSYEMCLNILVHKLFETRNLIEDESFSSLSKNPKSQKLCKDQYKRIFTSYRKPKLDVDELIRRRAGNFFIEMFEELLDFNE